jgi:hypothetical protein
MPASLYDVPTALYDAAVSTVNHDNLNSEHQHRSLVYMERNRLIRNGKTGLAVDGADVRNDLIKERYNALCAYVLCHVAYVVSALLVSYTVTSNHDDSQTTNITNCTNEIPFKITWCNTLAELINSLPRDSKALHLLVRPIMRMMVQMEWYCRYLRSIQSYGMQLVTPIDTGPIITSEIAFPNKIISSLLPSSIMEDMLHPV